LIQIYIRKAKLFLIKWLVRDEELIVLSVENMSELQALVAKKTNIKSNIIKQVISLLDEGNTVPFIARYRKEVTGRLDEVQIKDSSDEWT